MSEFPPEVTWILMAVGVLVGLAVLRIGLRIVSALFGVVMWLVAGCLYAVAGVLNGLAFLRGRIAR